MYFSDIYSDRRIPEKLLKDQVLHGECLSEALYLNDFLYLVQKVGFKVPRIIKDRIIVIDNEEIEDKIGFAIFFSATHRLIKIDGLEEDCEDYGKSIIYKCTVNGSKNLFILDNHHWFEKLKEYPVCGNTFKILKWSRFSRHFDFKSNCETYYGIFGQSKSIPFKFSYSCWCSKNSCCGENK